MTTRADARRRLVDAARRMGMADAAARRPSRLTSINATTLADRAALAAGVALSGKYLDLWSRDVANAYTTGYGGQGRHR